MPPIDRREMLSASAAAGLALGASGTARASAMPGALVHHVLFWLKNPESVADRDALIAGIRGGCHQNRQGRTGGITSRHHGPRRG